MKGVRMTIKFHSLPIDRSLQAFKDWMQSYHLNPNVENRIISKHWFDEEHWIENWKKFWAKVDTASKSQRSGDDKR
jgi:hypothetical protein